MWVTRRRSLWDRFTCLLFHQRYRYMTEGRRPHMTCMLCSLWKEVQGG